MLIKIFVRADLLCVRLSYVRYMTEVPMVLKSDSKSTYSGDDSTDKHSRVYERCLRHRDRSEVLMARSHRLMVNSEVIACTLRLQLRRLRILLDDQHHVRRRVRSLYGSAIYRLHMTGR